MEPIKDVESTDSIIVNADCGTKPNEITDSHIIFNVQSKDSSEFDSKRSDSGAFIENADVLQDLDLAVPHLLI